MKIRRTNQLTVSMMSISSGFYLQLSSHYTPQNIYPGIPKDISKQYDVVPLWSGKDEYSIGTAEPDFRGTEEMERIVKKPVIPYLLTYAQIQTLQAQIYNEDQPLTPEIDLREINTVLHGGEKEFFTAVDDRISSPDGKQKIQKLDLHERAYLESLGVRYQIPHIDLNMVALGKNLAGLIPLQEANMLQVIPLWWMGNCLYLGCNAGKLPADLASLSKFFPFTVKLVLCDEKQWKAAFRTIYLEQEKPRQISLEERLKVLREKYSLDPADLQRARIYSSQYNSDLLTALLELKIVTAEMLLEVDSQLTGVPILEGGFQPHQDWADRLPADIGRRLEIIAFDESDTTISIAANQITRAKIDLVQSIGQKKVLPFLIDLRRLQSWMEIVYSTDVFTFNKPHLLSLKDTVLTIGFVSQEQMREVMEFEELDDHQLGEVLKDQNFLDDIDLAVALSIQTGLPFVLLEHANLPQDFGAGFPADLAEKFKLLPLFQQENTIWVASHDPFNGKGFHELKKRMNKHIVPILAPQKVLIAILEQKWGRGRPEVSGEAHPYIQKLIQADFLTQSQAFHMLQLIDEQGLPFDQAFLQASYFDVQKANQVLSSIFSVPVIDVNLVEEQTEQIDGLGNKVTKPVYHDPVALSAASMIALTTANQYCLLPVRKEGQHILVAFADPVQTQNLELLKGLFSLPILPALAIRSDLEDAIARNLGRKNIGTYLLENSYITRRQLNDALELSKKTGVRLGQALLIKQYIQEKQMYEILAKQAELPFVDLNNVSIPKETARLIDAEVEREYGIMPIKVTKNELTLAIVDPFDQKAVDLAHELTGKKIKPVVVTDANLEQILENIYHGDYTTISTSNLLIRSPRESAFHVLSTGQTIFFLILLFLSIMMAILDFTSFMIVVNELITIFYIGFSAYKFYLVYNAMNHDCEVPVSKEEIDALDPRELPVYTLLIPVYKEASVLPDLMKSLSRLDYPSTKLDIKILLEADDQETIQSFYDMHLPPHFRATIVPGSLPKTKPKACNYGLIHARGEYIVIFDAEDRPDPDQLKKAVVAFQKSSPNVVCIQAKLNYYNRRQNLLTQWFTSEYSMWFDLFLPGLDASNAPIPLGGTSNHFKRRALAEVGAWDPHNVTEDADLGMRLYKRGYHTRTIDSTTYEEANSRLNNWLRQRSRWIKGYIQTWLVHMRNPVQLMKEVGLNGFISFQFVTGGTFFAALVNPILWTITTVWYLTKWQFIQETFPGFIYYLSSLSLYLGNFVFTYMNVAGAMRRRHYDNVRFALLSPVYWGLMSVGAWKGFVQLITKPHYWEKTIHGFSQDYEDETQTEPGEGEDHVA